MAGNNKKVALVSSTFSQQQPSLVEDAGRQPKVVSFGVFQVDLDSVELRKHGRRIKLQDQPFQILAELLAHPAQIVTRECLCRKLWPSGTFVDFENSVNIAISKLRQALGDSAENPRFIETLPRHGYRFIAPVTPQTRVAPISSFPIPIGQQLRDSDMSSCPDRGVHKLETTTSHPVTALRHWLRQRRSQLLLAAVFLVALFASVLVLDSATVRQRLRTRMHANTIEALAVLPFENIGIDPGQDQYYLATGITEELIAELAQIRDLRVTSRTTVMHYKGTRKTAPEIGQELDVDGIVEGAVMHDRDRVRIVVKLVHTKADKHLWAGVFDRSLEGNMIASQRDLTRDIASAIKAALYAGTVTGGLEQSSPWIASSRRLP